MTDQTSAFANVRLVPAVVDRSAVALSSLCVLHCLALPVIVSVLPLAGVWAEAEWAHKAFVIMAIPVSGYAVFIRGIHFRDRIFVVLVTLGMTLLVAAAFIENFHDYEQLLTAVGAVLVAGSHLWRWRCHRSAQYKIDGKDRANKT